MSRSVAREVAMKLVYSRLLGGDDTPDAVLEKSEIKEPLDLADEAFSLELADGVEATLGEVDALIAEVRAELNVESVESFTSAGDLVEYSAKGNFRNLGKRFAKRTPQVAGAYRRFRLRVRLALQRNPVGGAPEFLADDLRRGRHAAAKRERIVEAELEVSHQTTHAR